MSTPCNILVGACLLGAGIATHLVRPAYGSDFTAFAEDEDVCRHVGTAAINGGAGPSAAQRYDMAYRRCMMSHGRMRQIDSYRSHAPTGVIERHSYDFPDAFYSVPYATPGYGYDGFSY